MSFTDYLNAPVLPHEPPKIIRRYSITADILSYLKCPRRYGYFRARNFAPASAIQLYFGTIIHEVLDRAHLNYSGLLSGTTRGEMPSDDDIEKYFVQVENALRARGIRSMSKDLADKAKLYLKNFNNSFGPKLYPRVIDTEHKLQMHRNIGRSLDYILRGVVDVLASNIGGSTDPADVEIWDYKASKMPITSAKDLENYQFQMQVYGELYKFRNAVYPSNAVLVYIGEFENPNPKESDVILEVPLNLSKINIALNKFEKIVIEIEREYSRPFDQAWKAPSLKDRPDKDTCNACDLRWSCSSRSGEYPMKAP